jgi:GT2 family glycosyltransferase
MTRPMQCAVVIPCHNGVDLTRDCLRSLHQQTDVEPLEILVVDNRSTDATSRLGDEFPGVRVLTLPENRGFAGGVNAGIAATRSREVLILNNDTRAATNLVAELRRALASDCRIGAVAPVSNHVKGPARLAVGDQARDDRTRQNLAEALATIAAPLQDVDSLAGLCLLVRRSTLAEVGPFDERFGHGNFEDDDFCLRLRLHGYRLVLAHRAFLHHEGHATFRAMGLPIADELARRRAQFVAKWRHDPAGRATIAAMYGHLAQAADEAVCAARRWPRWPDADLHRARALDAAGAREAAAHHWRSLLANCPAHSEAAQALVCHHLHRGDDGASARMLAWAAAASQWQPEHHARLARELAHRAQQLGRPDEAIDHLRAAVAQTPRDGPLQNELGAALLARGAFAAARDAFAAAFELGHTIALTNVGICEYRLAEPQRALATCARAAELLPRDPIAQTNLRTLRAALEPVGGRG